MPTGVSVLVPELVTVALPPPVVCEAKPLAVPELVVVAFWFAPAALLVKGVGAVPELVQVLSVTVVVQMNCAEAGELANSAMAETVAAQHSALAEAKAAHVDAPSRAATFSAVPRATRLQFLFANADRVSA
jgi:hypothetical protein